MNDAPAILGLRTLIHRADAAHKAACEAPVTSETSALVERINTYLCGLYDAATQMGVAVPEFRGDVRLLCGSACTVEFMGAKFAVFQERLLLMQPVLVGIERTDVNATPNLNQNAHPHSQP